MRRRCARREEGGGTEAHARCAFLNPLLPLCAQIVAAVLAAVLGAQPRAPAALSASFSSAVSSTPLLPPIVATGSSSDMSAANAPGPGPSAGLAIGLAVAAATLLLALLAATVLYVRATGSCCGVHAVCVPLASCCGAWPMPSKRAVLSSRALGKQQRGASPSSPVSGGAPSSSNDGDASAAAAAVEVKNPMTSALTLRGVPGAAPPVDPATVLPAPKGALPPPPPPPLADRASQAYAPLQMRRPAAEGRSGGAGVDVELQPPPPPRVKSETLPPPPGHTV